MFQITLPIFQPKKKIKYIFAVTEGGSLHLIHSAKKNKKINNLKNVQLIKKAVDTKKGSVEFTKIVNNTTDSFIKNVKKQILSLFHKKLDGKWLKI